MATRCCFKGTVAWTVPSCGHSWNWQGNPTVFCIPSLVWFAMTSSGSAPAKTACIWCHAETFCLHATGEIWPQADDKSPCLPPSVEKDCSLPACTPDFGIRQCVVHVNTCRRHAVLAVEVDMHAGAILAHVQFVDLAFVATALYLATGRLEHGPRVAAELGPMAEWAKTGSRPSVDALMSSWWTRLEGTPSITLPHV